MEHLMYLLLWLMVIVGLVVFCSTRKHLLLTLLSLEFLVLALFMFVVLYVKMYMFEYYFILIFLTFVVCEGALGLSILVSLIRCHGSDNVMSLSFLSW